MAKNATFFEKTLDLPLCGSCIKSMSGGVTWFEVVKTVGTVISSNKVMRQVVCVEVFMKIKQVEELVGITSKNIRFYENQGLLTPERAENGYREYHQKNIDELKKIKLLRKLGVSVEEIRAVLGKTVSLEECLEKHVGVLEKERENLDNMHKLSKAILENNDTVDTLNTDEWLDEIEKMEREGVDFVNLSKIDIHMKKKMGALIGGVAVIAVMIVWLGIFLWANRLEKMPVGIFIIFTVIPAAIIVCIIVAIRSRLKEIEGGEEDEASKY